jgi:hypothetical protein
VQPVASLPGWLEFDDDLRLSVPQRSMTARRRNARLDTDPPRAIRRDAPGPTQGRRYGVLELGELGHSFAYALDTGAAPRMYFDRNANGDLTDDGPPLKRQGSAYFGRRISLPAALLFDQSQGERGFAIWFWTTADWLAEGHASYYTRTQLQGTIQVDGLRRDAWIVDAGEADGRFFGEDDILWVDVNQDGSFERANESFRGLASLESTGLREAIQRSR